MAEQQALQVVRVSSEGLGGEAVETVTGLARAAVEDITEGVAVALQVEAGAAEEEVPI
jgi:hypothetical protein